MLSQDLEKWSLLYNYSKKSKYLNWNSRDFPQNNFSWFYRLQKSCDCFFMKHLRKSCEFLQQISWKVKPTCTFFPLRLDVMEGKVCSSLTICHKISRENERKIIYKVKVSCKYLMTCISTSLKWLPPTKKKSHFSFFLHLE